MFLQAMHFGRRLADFCVLSSFRDGWLAVTKHQDVCHVQLRCLKRFERTHTDHPAFPRPPFRHVIEALLTVQRSLSHSDPATFFGNLLSAG